MKKEDFFSELKNECPGGDERERNKEIIKLFIVKDGKELTKLYCKSDFNLLADVIEKFIRVSFEEYGFNSLYYLSLPGYTYQCALK